MGSMNRVFLMGNLTRDPKLRRIPSGAAVSELDMAISQSYRTKDGEMAESTCFVNVVVWGKQAETCEKFLSKGAPVMVEGSLQLDQWETEQKEKRSRLRVRASRVQFLGQPRNGQAQAAQEEDQPMAI